MAKTNSGLLEFKDAQKVLIALDDATSEVKKAVVIDADGVETDIQGVQPTGKKEITSTAEVNVANYATAQVVDEDLVAGNIKKDVDILGVVGTYEGGGGSSDFSMAKVTVINTSSEYANTFKAPIVIDGVEFGTTYEVDIPVSQTVIANIVMFKGNSLAFISDVETTSGDIQSIGGNRYLITGDCTITVS